MAADEGVLKDLPEGMTTAWISKMIQDAMKLKNAPTLSNMKRLDENTGMCSVILSLDLGGISDQPLGVIAKFPTGMKIKGWGFADADSIIKRIHNNECFAYGLLDGKGMTIPTCLGSLPVTEPGTGAIVFKRFARPTYMPNMLTGLTATQLKVILASLARLHGFGFCDKSWENNDKVRKQLKDMYEGISTETCEKALNVWEEHIGSPLLVDRKKLLQLASGDRWNDLACSVKHRTYCHGDLWVNNMLVFDDGKRDQDEFAAILDWQALHIGCIGVDLGRLLTHNTCHTVLAAHETELLQHYFTELTNVCKQEYNCDVPFDLTYVKEEFDRFLGLGALFTFYQCTLWKENVERCFEGASDEVVKRFYERVRVNLERAIKNGV